MAISLASALAIAVERCSGLWWRDNPNATVEFLNTGHFAIETYVDEIAAAMHKLLERV